VAASSAATSATSSTATGSTMSAASTSAAVAAHGSAASTAATGGSHGRPTNAAATVVFLSAGARGAGASVIFDSVSGRIRLRVEGARGRTEEEGIGEEVELSHDDGRLGQPSCHNGRLFFQGKRARIGTSWHILGRGGLTPLQKVPTTFRALPSSKGANHFSSAPLFKRCQPLFGARPSSKGANHFSERPLFKRCQPLFGAPPLQTVPTTFGAANFRSRHP
jgi:hypothetical protein